MCIYLYICWECFIFDTCVHLFRMNIFDISLDLEYLSFNFLFQILIYDVLIEMLIKLLYLFRM